MSEILPTIENNSDSTINGTYNEDVIKATINLDIVQALKKFTNKNIMLVAKLLRLNGSLTFGELQNKTALSINLLNHALHEMKKSNLVTQISKRYYLTKFCAVLLDSIDRLRIEIRNISAENDELFAPVMAT